MDWVVDTSGGENLPALRKEVVAYLRRHADDSADIESCELVISELLTNVARHASGPAWVTIDWSARQPTLQVADVGSGFDLHIEMPPDDSIGGRGLFIVNHLVPKLESFRRAAGGSVVTVTLPVHRSPAVSIDPPRRRTAVLPSIDEADPTGGFGKEPFLRALVAQLAHTVTEQQGPDAAERAVAPVGGQMELEYRLATGVAGQLTVEQLAHCFVRLKNAIDGGFFVVEVRDDVQRSRDLNNTRQNRETHRATQMRCDTSHLGSPSWTIVMGELAPRPLVSGDERATTPARSTNGSHHPSCPTTRR